MAAYYKVWTQGKPDSKADEIGSYNAWKDEEVSGEKRRKEPPFLTTGLKLIIMDLFYELILWLLMLKQWLVQKKKKICGEGGGVDSSLWEWRHWS